MAMPNYPIFSVIGLEIEYMIVDQENLNIAPCSDLLLEALGGSPINEVSLEKIGVSNELVMHVIELKNKVPVPITALQESDFEKTLHQLVKQLAPHGLSLMPTGAHPWMNPQTETKLWPYDNHEIYESYHRIFNSHHHGFANLQSMHINLPFQNSREFLTLHTLIRLLLPLLPALSASTPFLEGLSTGKLDSRLEYYGKNQSQIPEIAGNIIPEWTPNIRAYQENILKPMYEAIAPFDPQGHLQYEWLNSRAAIPKFESGAIEIRIIDTQECTKANIAIAKFIFFVLQHWAKDATYQETHPCNIHILKTLYDKVIQNGTDVIVDDSNLFKQWQIDAHIGRVDEILEILLQNIRQNLSPTEYKTLHFMISKGNLAKRMLTFVGHQPSRTTLKTLYTNLMHCHEKNSLFQMN